MTTLRYDFEAARWIARVPDAHLAARLGTVPEYDIASKGEPFTVEMVNVTTRPRWRQFLRLPVHLVRLRSGGVMFWPAFKMAWICVWL